MILNRTAVQGEVVVRGQGRLEISKIFTDDMTYEKKFQRLGVVLEGRYEGKAF